MQAYSATRKLAGLTGLASLTGHACFAGHANFAVLQNQDARREGGGEVLVRNPEEGGDRDGRAVLDEDAALALVRFGEGHVPRVEDGDAQAHDVSDRSLVESHDSLRGADCAVCNGRQKARES